MGPRDDEATHIESASVAGKEEKAGQNDSGNDGNESPSDLQQQGTWTSWYYTLFLHDYIRLFF